MSDHMSGESIHTTFLNTVTSRAGDRGSVVLVKSDHSGSSRFLESHIVSHMMANITQVLGGGFPTNGGAKVRDLTGFELEKQVSVAHHRPGALCGRIGREHYKLADPVGGVQ